MNPFRTTCAAIFIACLTLPQPARAADALPRIISTTGESVVYVAPDQVIVNFGVETSHADLDKATTTNDDASTRLVKAIKALPVEEKYIQTDNMEVELRYKSGDRIQIEGYIVRRAYSITLKDPKNFEKLITTALKNGANRLNGFEFRTTELRKYRDQARSMAIKAAKEKAAALVADLGVKLGSPHTISEGGGYWGYSGGRWSSLNMQTQNSVQSAPAANEGGGDETMPLGQIGVRATVNVTFDLVD